MDQDKINTEWSGALLDTITQHLKRRERARAVTRVGFGGGFEGWLATEARLAIESRRRQIARTLAVDPGAFFTANEYPNKTDLSIWAGGRPVAALEFKIAYNNKNWKSQCDSVWNDLFPTRTAKRAWAGRRFAVVASVWKQYEDSAYYPGQDAKDGPSGWRERLRSYLYWKDGWYGNHVALVAGPSKIRFAARFPGAVADAGHGLELEILAARPSDKERRT